MSEEIWVQEDNIRRKLEGEELQAFLADRATTQAQQQVEEEAKAAKLLVRESAIAKLTALGLTETEIEGLIK